MSELRNSNFKLNFRLLYLTQKYSLIEFGIKMGKKSVLWEYIPEATNPC